MPTTWESLLNTGAPWQTASGTTLNTAATATISPEAAGGTGDDPQIFSFYQGQAFRVRARGIYSSGSTSTNFTLALFANVTGSAASGGTSLATTGAVAWPVSVTNFYWELEALLQVRQMASGTGTSTVYTHGAVEVQTATFSTPTGNTGILPMPATNGPAAATLDTTITHTIALVGTLSQATGSPSITCTSFLVEQLNT
jgi:hypothetical protein